MAVTFERMRIGVARVTLQISTVHTSVITFSLPILQLRRPNQPVPWRKSEGEQKVIPSSRLRWHSNLVEWNFTVIPAVLHCSSSECRKLKNHFAAQIERKKVEPHLLLKVSAGNHQPSSMPATAVKSKRQIPLPSFCHLRDYITY